MVPAKSACVLLESHRYNKHRYNSFYSCCAPVQLLRYNSTACATVQLTDRSSISGLVTLTDSSITGLVTLTDSSISG